MGREGGGLLRGAAIEIENRNAGKGRGGSKGGAGVGGVRCRKVVCLWRGAAREGGAGRRASAQCVQAAGAFSTLSTKISKH